MDKRKEEIIEVATRRFCHYGFSKTTMNEIAEDLRITKANLYYYYQDKSALIKDVICRVSDILLKSEQQLLAQTNKDFLGTLFALLELRASHMRTYYILYINENLDWIKGIEIGDFIDKIKLRDSQLLKGVIQEFVDNGELFLNDLDEAVETYTDIIRGVGFMHTAHDVVTGIPNPANVDKILASQKRVTKLIFEDKIVTKK